ncbi:MAG: hypothetical protein V4488_05860 [Pseudomonadota bacterium]
MEIFEVSDKQKILTPMLVNALDQIGGLIIEYDSAQPISPLHLDS